MIVDKLGYIVRPALLAKVERDGDRFGVTIENDGKGIWQARFADGSRSAFLFALKLIALPLLREIFGRRETRRCGESRNPGNGNAASFAMVKLLTRRDPSPRLVPVDSRC